jgi:hypothetical protein
MLDLTLVGNEEGEVVGKWEVAVIHHLYDYAD